MGRLSSFVASASCVLVLLLCAAPSQASLGVVTWGRGLGAGNSLGESQVPVPVCAVGASGSCIHGPYLHNVVEISAGSEFDLALLSDGKVVAWGKNEFGQLGIGTTGAEKRVPVEIPSLSGVKAISAGLSRGLALLGNGSVMSWGYGPYGELGDGSLTTIDAPVPVCAVGHTGSCPSPSEQLSGVTAVSAGSFSNLALLSNGEVASWGENMYGELGNGTTSGPETCNTHACSTDPVHVEHITQATAVSAGWYEGMALLQGGEVESWGFDDEGNLGDGTTKVGFSNIDSDVPVFVCALGHTGTCPNPSEQLTGAAAISDGGQKNLVQLSGGEAVSWGSNESGSLGIGTMSGPDTCEGGPCSTDPVEVINLGNEVAAVSAGNDGVANDDPAALALLKSGRVMSWGDNSVGVLGTGGTGASDEPIAVCAVEHAGTCPNPSEDLTGATTVSTDGFSDSMAIAPVSECQPTTGQWYSDNKLICEPVVVETKGKLTLHILAGEATISCKVKDLETLENPGTDGPGLGTVSEFALSHCKSKGAPVCARGETLEVPANTPWHTELLTGSPIRDLIPDAELRVICHGASETLFDQLTGTLMPEIGTSILAFGSGSGEMSETKTHSSATITGTDKMKGPKKDRTITAQAP